VTDVPFKKYSKSSGFYTKTHKEFFTENESLLAKIEEHNRIYREQPVREYCKLCHEKLPTLKDLVSHDIPYFFCSNCGHFNGAYEDTKEFVKKIYLEDTNYSDHYVNAEFDSRTKNIYVPKVDFLAENLPPGIRPRVLDIGCGSGNFVYACLQRDIEAVGIDFSAKAVDFGNQQIRQRLNKSPLTLVSEETFFQSIVGSDASVLSAIGVLEHLREPDKLFDAFEKSRMTYLFYSVPMFSASVIFENAFPAVFPRQLGGDHTHLFTESSVEWMHKNKNLCSLAEWRFGTGVMDLYRSLLITLKKNGASDKLLKIFEEGFAQKIDALQAVLDKNNFCSEIHCLVKKERMS